MPFSMNCKSFIPHIGSVLQELFFNKYICWLGGKNTKLRVYGEVVFAYKAPKSISSSILTLVHYGDEVKFVSKLEGQHSWLSLTKSSMSKPSRQKLFKP